MSAPEAAAIARELAKHGVPATLTREGDSYSGVAALTQRVRVLNRSYEGSQDSGPTGMSVQAARWMVPAAGLAWAPKAYDRLDITGLTGAVTITRVDPGFARGVPVRYDLEVSGGE